MRIVTALFIVVVVLSMILAGCNPEESAPSGTTDAIADKIFNKSGVVFRAPERLSLERNEDKEFYLGSPDYPEFTDSVVVVPMIRIDTRLLVVIKAANKGDIEEIKTKLKENIDPTRLICVTFTLEDVVIDNRGDVIFMTINSNVEEKAALVEAFKTID